MNLENVILPLLGVVIGAWLANSFFPFRLKRREWRWEKELWARELFFETLSRISFISDHYLKGEYSEKFSMSGLSLFEADKEITGLIKELHSQGFKIRLYLDKKSKLVFDSYLSKSQEEYDEAKESWGQWYSGDDQAEISHREETIFAQKQVADQALKHFEV